ncbi:MAG: ribosomal protein S6--L-glutamate ligase [Cellvibrionaceae bacterium]|jgi:ribosomal protein S6--L-glutamate ligase
MRSPLQQNRKTTIHCEAPVIDRRNVKSSSGESEKRGVIQAPKALGDYEWGVEPTLTNRDSMGYRMLLGRQAMQRRMLVDPPSNFLLGNKAPEEID